MFDAVLEKTPAPRKLGLGAVLSIAFHAALVTALIGVGARNAPAPAERDVPFVMLRAPAPAAALIRGAAEASPTPTRRPPVHHKTRELVAPAVVPTAPPEEATPSEPAEPVTGEFIGDPNGPEVGGSKTGLVGGTLDGDPDSKCVGPQCTGIPGLGGTDSIPFGAGMTRPELLSGRQPQYTREALESRVSGVMLVKCVITTEGALTNCRVIRPLPHMTDEVLAALATQKYSPVVFNGQPVAVDYLFTFRFEAR